MHPNHRPVRTPPPRRQLRRNPPQPPPQPRPIPPARRHPHQPVRRPHHQHQPPAASYTIAINQPSSPRPFVHLRQPVLYLRHSEDHNQPLMNPLASTPTRTPPPASRYALLLPPSSLSPTPPPPPTKKPHPPNPPPSTPPTTPTPTSTSPSPPIPATLPADCAFFRLPYVEHGFLPVRVIITNDGDPALSLDDARIQFISANNDKIPAATTKTSTAASSP